MSEDLKRLKIHFFYIIFILSTGIVVISTYQWTALKDFTSYLSNAATMTSLVLGLVAIFYSFISNDGLSKSLGNISEVAADVKQSKQQIQQFLHLTERSTDSANESARAIESVSGAVTASIESLRDTLDAIRTQTDSLTSLPDLFGRLEGKVDAIKIPVQKTDESSKTRNIADFVTAEGIRYFLSSSSVITNMLTYACVLSKESGRTFSLYKLSKIVEFEQVMYFVAYLQSWQSFRIVLSDQDKNDALSYRVKFLHPILQAEARDYLNDYVSRAYKEDPVALEKMRTKISAIEAFFESQAVPS